MQVQHVDQLQTNCSSKQKTLIVRECTDENDQVNILGAFRFTRIIYTRMHTLRRRFLNKVDIFRLRHDQYIITDA